MPSNSRGSVNVELKLSDTSIPPQEVSCIWYSATSFRDLSPIKTLNDLRKELLLFENSLSVHEYYRKIQVIHQRENKRNVLNSL